VKLARTCAMSATLALVGGAPPASYLIADFRVFVPSVPPGDQDPLGSSNTAMCRRARCGHRSRGGERVRRRIIELGGGCRSGRACRRISAPEQPLPRCSPPRHRSSRRMVGAGGDHSRSTSLCRASAARVAQVCGVEGVPTRLIPPATSTLPLSRAVAVAPSPPRRCRGESGPRCPSRALRSPTA